MRRASLLGLGFLLASASGYEPAYSATMLVQDQAAKARGAAHRDAGDSINPGHSAATAEGAAPLPTDSAMPALSVLLAGGFAVFMVLRRRKRPPSVNS